MRRALALAVIVIAVLIAAISFVTCEPDGPIAEAGTPGSARVASDASVSDAGTLQVEPRTIATPSSNADDTVTASTPPSKTGFRLFGTISPVLAGSPVESVSVTCTDRLGESVHTLTGDGWEYSFEDVEPGSHWLVASADLGIARARVDVQGDTRVDLQLEALRTIRVIAVDRNGVAWKPRDVEVAVTRTSPGEWLPRTSDSDRVHRNSVRRMDLVNRPEFASFVLEREESTFVSLVAYESVIATKYAGPGDADLEFVLEPGDPRLSVSMLRFRFVDSMTGLPLEPSDVAVEGATSIHIPCPKGVGAITLWPGRYWLSAFARPSSFAQVSFRFERGVDLDLGDIAIGAGVPFRGIVVDQDGRGVVASIDCVRCDEFGVSDPESSSTLCFQSREDGTFGFRGPPGNFMRLSASYANVKLKPGTVYCDLATVARVIDLRAKRVDGIVLHLRPGIPLVVHPSQHMTSESRFRVLSSDGTVMSSRRITRDGPERVLLAPGTFQVEMWHERDGPRERVTVQLVSDPVVIDMP